MRVATADRAALAIVLLLIAGSASATAWLLFFR